MPKVLVLLRILLGLLFAAAGVAKLLGAPMLVAEFATIGFGQWLRYLTGVLEIGGALLLIRPATASLGAALLVCICAGAFAAQAAILHMDVIHTIVLGALAAWVAWSYRRDVRVASR